MSYQKLERLLSISDVHLQYGDKVILRDINTSIFNITRPGVAQGQVVALLGLSGSGKTQLFRCIAGLQPPTRGRILLRDSNEHVKAGQVGVVQQAYPLLQHRTVWSNLMLTLKRHHADVKKGEAEAQRLLAHFGVAEKKNNYPAELSGGQRQRVAIIQQLLCSNHFLLMDEPFSGLDVMAKQRVFDTIRDVSSADEHNTLIFTTHDLEAAVALADEIWVLGREEGKPGATIVKTIDLAAKGLAWAPDIERHALFYPTVLELKETFAAL
jgi:ABC-type nitrate/sulfonate/bicarbonate transport system ATPase subunit